MGDPVVPERPGGRNAAAQEQAGIPAMPVILQSEQVSGSPYLLLDGLSPTLGWEFRPPAKGGPAFVIVRRTGLGSLKVVDSFPLTEDGWARGLAILGQAESCGRPADSGQAVGPGGRYGEAESAAAPASRPG